MQQQARELGESEKLWKDTGVLHDVDYARVYFDMGQHGHEGARILLRYGLTSKIVEAVDRHNTLDYQDSHDPYERAVFISGRFLKKMVHAARRFHRGDISKLNYDEFSKVYELDVRRNEKLTSYDPTPEPFADFKAWMDQHTQAINGYALSEERLFSLAQNSFAQQGTRLSLRTNCHEGGELYEA